MMAGEVAWALFEALELVIVDLRIKRLCFALRVAGATTMLLGMLAFVLRYTGHERWLAPRRFAAIAAPMLALTLLAWTNPWHHLYWRSIGTSGSAVLDRHAGLRPGVLGALRLQLRPGGDRDRPAGPGRVPIRAGCSGPRPRSCSSGCCCRGW